MKIEIYIIGNLLLLEKYMNQNYSNIYNIFAYTFLKKFTNNVLLFVNLNDLLLNVLFLYLQILFIKI